jgi:Uma2 family endonuclease
MRNAVAGRRMTVEEFAGRRERVDDAREELVRGVIVTSPIPRFRNGCVQATLACCLDAFVRPRQLGCVVLRTGVITERDPDTVRGPDVSFWSAERLPLNASVEIYPDVAPDLCVEILSPDERPTQIQQQLREYFACGVRMVWVVDPQASTVTVFREPTEGRLLCEDARLSGEDVLPGFECRVGELFV